MDGTNWFAYCGNNPVNRLDGDGKNRFIEDTNAQHGLAASAACMLAGFGTAAWAAWKGRVDAGTYTKVLIFVVASAAFAAYAFANDPSIIGFTTAHADTIQSVGTALVGSVISIAVLGRTVIGALMGAAASVYLG